MTYEELFTFENLYAAHIKARKNKRSKEDVILFEQNLSYNIWVILTQLWHRKYHVSGYHKFMIYEPKEREIQALWYKDRVVQHALCDCYLSPLILPRLIYTNCACQRGKGTDFAIKYLTKYLSDYYKKNGNQGYILKADIHHFFPSIDHKILKKQISKIVDDKDILDLLNSIIDSFNGDIGKGIPMGNQTSQLFALYYLNPVDRHIKENLRIKYYIRYMDDMIIIHNDKNFLRKCLEEISSIAESLCLEFNSKTQIIPIKNGVEFVGFRFCLTSTGKVIRKIRNQSKKKYKRRMNKLKEEYANGEKTLDEIRKVLPGYKGHLKRGHTYNLQKNVMKRFILKRKIKE